MNKTIVKTDGFVGSGRIFSDRHVFANQGHLDKCPDGQNGQP